MPEIKSSSDIKAMVDIKVLKLLATDFKILYVEDEDDLRHSVTLYLKKIFSLVDTAEDGLQGLEKYHAQNYDIVITDIHMPNMNGLEMLRGMKAFNDTQEVIIVSAYSDTQYFIDAISMGVNAYIFKPVDYAQMNNTLFKSVNKLVSLRENEYYKEHLAEMVENRTHALFELEKQNSLNYEKTIIAFIEMVENRDTYTGGHSQRVALYSKLIAQAMGRSEVECDMVYQAGILHDIGKIATPDTILLKPGKLTKLEYQLIQQHVSVSYDLLYKIPMYNELADIVISHHERYDGKGYPHGLKEDEIPPLAQIMIVADAFDAMTTNRIYKGRKEIDEAINELNFLSGTQFHPEVIDVAKTVLSDVNLADSIGQLPITDLEQERFAYFYNDQITNAYNTDYLDFILNRNSFSWEYGCINILYLHNFNQYNQKYGWSEGNVFLRKLVDALHKRYQSSMLFRLHGDDFVLLNKEHINVDMNQFNEMELFNNTYINVSKQHFDLKKDKISSLKSLEMLI